MVSKNKDIIFLLGAGASAEALIPPSAVMVHEIEKLLKEDSEWRTFLPLYHHIKSAIYYAAGLKGSFGPDVPYNIETLVNTLYELERNEQHPLYPFIASWNSRLMALAEGDFARVKSFRRLILRKLKKWMSPDDPSKASYYEGFRKLQKDLNSSLRVFSLNYDLCIERLNSTNFRVESGFAGVGTGFAWDWERFEDNDAGPPPPEIYLYKLHGSINWRRDKQSKNLYSLEQTEGIEPEDMEVIFGRDFKLEAADPYLFYAYALRMFTLDARLIIAIGYGFGDGHINKMLAQALKADPSRRLVIVAKCAEEADRKRRGSDITSRLEAVSDQIIVRAGSAKEFLETPNLMDELLAMIPKPPDAPF